MRRVVFSPALVPPGEEEFWSTWQQNATDATESMLERARSGEPFKADRESIWKQVKEWYLEHVFAGKCAYCEGTYLAGSPQHAEHWRPKEGVTRLVNEREVPVETNGLPHRGYWWLAYRWENLVPACFYCNTGQGKGTKFPISGSYAFSPDENLDVAALNDREKPWLLHPFSEPAPELHIGFYSDGTAFAKDKSEYGFWTITVMDLNRENLVIARRKRQEEARDALGHAASDAVRMDRDVAAAMERWEGPAAPFSRAVEDHLMPIRGKVGSQLFGSVDA